MFNRQPFKRGRYNRRFFNRVEIYANAAIEFEATAEFYADTAFAGEAEINLSSEAELALVSKLEGNIGIELLSEGIFIVPRYLEGDADISLFAEAEEFIRTRNIGASDSPGVSSKFNRTKFNRGKFNASNHARCIVAMKLGASGELNTASSIAGNAHIEMAADGNILFRRLQIGGGASLEMTTRGMLNTNTNVSSRDNKFFSNFSKKHI